MAQSILITSGTQEKRLKQASILIEEITQISAPTSSHHPDVLLISPEPSIGIDQIRQLKHQLHLKPFQSEWQVALLTQADKATTEAQNALLKILEEPPPQVLIILETANQHLLLPTIISRCRLVRVLPELRHQSPEKRQNLLDQLLAANPSQAINLAQKNCSSSEKAHLVIQELIALLNSKIKANPQPSFATALKQALKSQKQLNLNLNRQLVIENLFLKLSQNSQESR